MLPDLAADTPTLTVSSGQGNMIVTPKLTKTGVSRMKLLLT